MHSARMLRPTGKYNTDCPVLSYNLSIIVPLEAIRRLAPSIRVGYTVGELTAEKEARARRMGAHHVGVRGEFITRELVARCNEPPQKEDAATGDGSLQVRWSDYPTFGPEPCSFGTETTGAFTYNP